ncbi:hypothetical protein PY257_03865 [Ramlibacter sp. H39-3-26]|nr:hypothetical protein [Ramlibacter sp. H39-3-26]
MKRLALWWRRALLHAPAQDVAALVAQPRQAGEAHAFAIGQGRMLHATASIGLALYDGHPAPPAPDQRRRPGHVPGPGVRGPQPGPQRPGAPV